MNPQNEVPHDSVTVIDLVSDDNEDINDNNNIQGQQLETNGDDRKSKRSEIRGRHSNKQHENKEEPHEKIKTKKLENPLLNQKSNNHQNKTYGACPIKLFAALESQKDCAARGGDAHTNHESQSQKYCWTLREMLGLDGNRPFSNIDFLVICNYILNIDFLLHEIPELLSIPLVIVFYGVVDTPTETWKTATTCTVEFIQLNPSAPPKTTANPTSPQSIPFGVHHSKIFLVGYGYNNCCNENEAVDASADADALRVVIHTANLRYNDVHLKAQGAFVQDFPLKKQSEIVASSMINGEKEKGESEKAAGLHSKKSPASSCLFSSLFEERLVEYFQSYGYRKQHVWKPLNIASSKNTTTSSTSNGCALSLTGQLQQYDYSSALGVLIPSIPGYHPMPTSKTQRPHGNNGKNPQGPMLLGHLCLRHAVAIYAQKHTQSGQKEDEAHEHDKTNQQEKEHNKNKKRKLQALPCPATATAPIVCQFSSIGSLTEPYLQELQTSMDSNAATAAQQQQSEAATNFFSRVKIRPLHFPLHLELVYPTVEEVRTSVEGYRGGGSVPGSTKNVKKPFLQLLYRKWSASGASMTKRNPVWKGGNVPHIKTYFQLCPSYDSSTGNVRHQKANVNPIEDDDASSLCWFLLTSHNLSKAAWGDTVQSRRHGERRFFIRHWELGVFVSPQVLQCRRLVPLSPAWDKQQLAAGDEAVPHAGDQEVQEEVALPIPYPVRPQVYESGDKPWCVDGWYGEKADRFGRCSAQDF